MVQERSPAFHCAACCFLFLCCLILKYFSHAAHESSAELIQLKAETGIAEECRRCTPCEIGNAACAQEGLVDGDCMGCGYGLGKLEGTAISGFNTTKIVPTGKTNNFVYRILPPEEGMGWPTNLLVKISCLPFYKHAYLKRHLWTLVMNVLDMVWSGEIMHNWLHYPCNTIVSQNNLKLELAVLRLAEMCGTDHLFPEMQFGPVKSSMPETGYEIDQEALFMTEAKGLPLVSIMSRIVDDEFTKELFMQKINSSQVVEAAVFDLFTRQRDRSVNNLFVAENGNIMLIDNTGIASLRVNSVMFPSTSYHAKMILGERFMQTRNTDDRNEYPLAGARIDYRCHSKGPIGIDYPPGLRKCMEHVQRESLETLSQELGLQSGWMLNALQESAKMLLEKGFEWVLANTAGGKFIAQDSCCDMVPVIDTVTGETAWSCGSDWHIQSNASGPNYLLQ